MKRALLWNYRFVRLHYGDEWMLPVEWAVVALRQLGWDVLRHPDVATRLDLGTSVDIGAMDLVLYTHTHIEEVRGFTGPQWFLKSTAPGQLHTTLDDMGYGPYSSITYRRPLFEDAADKEVERFFAEKVPEWIAYRTSKWGDNLLGAADIEEQDYVLVIGQTLGDATVQSMWFGNYLNSLFSVVSLLPQITKLPIVVKLHPWTDGVNGFGPDGLPIPPEDDELSTSLKERFEGISPQIRVYTGMSSVHDFLPRAKCVILCNSGSGLEALLHKKPVISWGYPEYHWVTYDLRHLCDLRRALTLDWFDRRAVEQFIYWYVERYAFSDANGALRRVEELLDIR